MSNLETADLLFANIQNGNKKDTEKLFDLIWNMIRGGLKPIELAAIQKISSWFQHNGAANPSGPGLALVTFAFIDFFANKFESSVDQLNDAIRMLKLQGDDDGAAVASFFLGVNYRALGVLSLALKYIMEAQAALQQSGKFPCVNVACGYQLAELHMETGNYAEAINQFNDYIEIAQKQDFSFFVSRIHAGLGSAYIKTQEYELAIQHLNAALKVSEECELHGVTAKVLTDIGDYHQLQKSYSVAIGYNNKARALREKLNLRNAVITNIINLAELFHLQHNTDEAIQLLMDGLAIARELKVKAKVYHIQLLLSQFYEAKGDVQESFYYFRQYHGTKEEINAEDSEKRIKNIKLVIEIEQARKENAIIRAQKQEIEEKHHALEVSIDELTHARNQAMAEKKRSDELLLNILPAEVAEELMNTGSAKARHFDEVTVLLTDFVGFTEVTEALTPQELVDELHHCFKGFDAIMGKYGIEKIKTVGDAYLAVCGLPLADEKHAEKMVHAALEISRFVAARRIAAADKTFDIRLGINSGSVVAGIVGVKKFAYDIWGDTVNTAARLEQCSEAGKVNISQATYELVREKFSCEYRGEIDAKNKGKLKMYFVS